MCDVFLGDLGIFKITPLRFFKPTRTPEKGDVYGANIRHPITRHPNTGSQGSPRIQATNATNQAKILVFLAS